jgi:hypothetical protein
MRAHVCVLWLKVFFRHCHNDIYVGSRIHIHIVCGGEMYFKRHVPHIVLIINIFEFRIKYTYFYNSYSVLLYFGTLWVLFVICNLQPQKISKNQIISMFLSISSSTSYCSHYNSSSFPFVCSLSHSSELCNHSFFLVYHILSWSWLHYLPSFVMVHWYITNTIKPLTILQLLANTAQLQGWKISDITWYQFFPIYWQCPD